MATVGVNGSSLQANIIVGHGERVNGHLVTSLHSSNGLGELLIWLSHGDSTINIRMCLSLI